MKPLFFNRAFSAFTVLVFSSISGHVRADNFTWTNGAANLAWDDLSSNWDSGSGDIPWVDGNVAVFGTNGAGTITVSDTRTITGFTINAGARTLTGGTIALGVASTPIEANQNLTINSAVTGGTNGITKTGVGYLTLGGGLANSFTGTIAVSAGGFACSDGASMKNVTGEITVSDGAIFNANQDYQGANPIANNIRLSGTGTGAQGALNVQGNADLKGAITLETDSKITHTWNSGGISGAITGVSKNLLLANLESGQPGMGISGNISLGTGSITIQSASGAGIFSLSGTNSYTGGTFIGVGGLSIGKGASTGTGDVTFTASSTLGGSATLTHLNKIVINSGISATVSPNALVAFTQSGPVTGDGSLTKTGGGVFLFAGGLANTFSGPIAVTGGRLACVNGASMKNVPGTVTVSSGGTFDIQQGFDANNIASNVALSGIGYGYGYGALNLQGNATLTGNVTLNADTTISHDYNAGLISGSVTGTNVNLTLTTAFSGQAPLTISGPLTLGTGGVTVKSAGGTAPVEFSGTLAYTGETKVDTGILSLTGSARLANSSTVRIATGAVLNLNFVGTDVVAALYLGPDGIPLASGTYGSLASTAVHKSAFFTGTGILSVSTGGSYTSWSALYAGNQDASGDYNNDGVPNGVAFFMGATGGFTSNPAPVGGAVTWPKNPAAAATYVIETSTNLMNEVVPGDGGWTPAISGVVDNGTSVVYTLGNAVPKRFARIKVVVAP